MIKNTFIHNDAITRPPISLVTELPWTTCMMKTKRKGKKKINLL